MSEGSTQCSERGDREGGGARAHVALLVLLLIVLLMQMLLMMMLCSHFVCRLCVANATDAEAHTVPCMSGAAHTAAATAAAAAAGGHNSEPMTHRNSMMCGSGRWMA